MYLSLNWLKDFVNIKKTPEELGLELTMHTVEIEGIQRIGENFDNVVVGKVKEIKKHPNADKLVIAMTDVGKKSNAHIVCGGVNLDKGMLVAVALPGAKVRWHGEGELIELEETLVRGTKSEGMICAANEIGLFDIFPHKEKEILDLSHLKLKPGENLAEALGLDDIIYELDNKSITHRPDLWGHYGIAREVAAWSGGKFGEFKLKKIKEGKENLKIEIKEKKLCPRYVGIVVDNVEIKSSSVWMQSRLLACGVRPINNIVDITNYVMLELGQPMHAFSSNLVNNNHIVVRKAEDGEEFTTLDGEKRKLDSSMLVIADTEKPIAIAGVMGGENSEIGEKTTSIILESANFDPVSVRKTSQKLGLRTESSKRFEKSLDPNLAPEALIRAVNLIQEIIPKAKVSSRLADEADFELDRGPIALPLDFLNKRIGEEIKKDKVIEILENLGFEVQASSQDVLSVKVPTWRATKDISIPEDLVEEVARIYGYDNIKPDMPEVKLGTLQPSDELELEREIKNIMSLGFGSNEIYNYSFLGADLLGKTGFDPESCISILNPVASDMNFMRPSLLPYLLLKIEENLNNFDRVNIFELGRIFKKEKGEYEEKKDSGEFLPKQHKYLANILTGNNSFYEVKNNLEVLLRRLGYDFEFIKMKGIHDWVHPVRTLSLSVSGKVIGLVAEISPMVLDDFDIKKRVSYFEFDFNALALIDKKYKMYEPLPKFPGIELDISMVVPTGAEWGDIENIIKKTGGDLIKKVSLFDIFEGKSMPQGKKSMAFRIEYRSDKKTLEKEEVMEIQERIIKALEKDFDAKVRK